VKIKLYSLWKSRNPNQGTGIIAKIEPIPPQRLGMYSECDGNLYHFISDFGNTVLLLSTELLSGYDQFGQETDIWRRLERQDRLLEESWSRVFGGKCGE
jgi:hypothetical protein